MKKLTILIGKILGFIFIWAILISISSIDTLSNPPLGAINSATRRLWWEFMPFLITLAVTFFFVKVIEKSEIKTTFTKKPIREVFLGITLGIIWIGSIVTILYFLGILKFATKNHVPYIYVWIFASFINVLMQEYFVRGYLFQLICSEYNIVSASIITTIIFTALHGGAIEAGLIPVLNVITMSIFMTLLLIYFKSLLVPTIVHSIWNAIGAIYLGSVGLAEDYPHIWNSIFQGNKLLSGGQLKLEGSIFVLVINGVMIIILSFMILKKDKKLNRNNMSIENI